MDTPVPGMFHLSFKTDDLRLRHLAQLYWESYRESGTVKFTYSVKELAIQFGLRQTAAAVTGPVMAAATAFNGACPRCHKRLSHPHRTAYLVYHARPNIPCVQCREKERRWVAAEQRKAIRSIYRFSARPIDTSRLSLKDAIYSLAVLRASRFSGSHWLGKLSPLTPPLSPTGEYDVDILRYLHTHNIIAPDPNSPQDCFFFDPVSGKPDEFFLLKVGWRLRASDPVGFAKSVESRVTAGTYPAAWANEAGELSRSIALHECISYAKTIIDSNALFWTIPARAASILSDALETYPVDQVLSLILNAAKQTVKTRIQGGGGERGEHFLSGFQQLVSDARRDLNVIEVFGRHPSIPQSAVSVVFYDLMFRAGDNGFTRLAGSFQLVKNTPSPKTQAEDQCRVLLDRKVIVQAIELAKRAEVETEELGLLAKQRRRLLSYLAGLSAADRAQVAAVMIIGRGDEQPDDFADQVRKWTRPLEATQAEYLAGKRHLSHFLQTGLECLSPLIPTTST